MSRTVSQTINLQTPDQTGKYISEIDQNGITVHPENQAQNSNYVHIDGSGFKIRNQAGAEPNINIDTALASFGTETVIKTTNGTELAHFGYAAGTGESGITVAPYYTLGVRKKTTTAYDSTATYSVGDVCIYNQKIYVCNTDITSPESWTSSHWTFYIGNHSYAEGYNIIASGLASHAEGYGTIALNSFSHAEGHNTSALNLYSHAEGYKTIASGDVSHAEGHGAIAHGSFSHAEGNGTVANGDVSHAEGIETVARGMASHAQNMGTIASKPAQTVIGVYNIEDTATNVLEQKLFIIGNGSDDSRSNAFTVDRNGNVDIASGAQYKVGGIPLSASYFDLVASYSSSNHVLSFGNFRIYCHYVTVPNTGRVSLTFPSGTFSQVLWAIPYCAQGGFGGYDTTSVTELTTSKVTLYQFNSAGANMNVGVVVFGLA